MWINLHVFCFRKKPHLSIGTTMIVILITKDSHQTFTVWVVCRMQGVRLLLMRALYPDLVSDTRTRHHTLREIRRKLKKVGTRKSLDWIICTVNSIWCFRVISFCLQSIKLCLCLECCSVPALGLIVCAVVKSKKLGVFGVLECSNVKFALSLCITHATIVGAKC